MRAEDLVRGVVRVWSRSVEGEPPTIVGTGFLVAPDLVLTCAHVAARAWGTDPADPDGLGRTVTIDFPATAPLDRREATVVRWLPRRPEPGGAYDLAGLALGGKAPAGASVLPLAVEDAPWGRPCRAFGFPAGRPDGAYAAGELRDVLANGWLLVKGGAEAREFTRPGYSGGPVVTDAGVVGILTEGDSDVRVREAVMLPVRTILASWPALHRSVSRPPYPGLAAFTAGDAPFFHGRNGAVAELAASLAAPPHLVVLAGPSGSGKSSLLAAGVLPRLAAHDPAADPAANPGANAAADPAADAAADPAATGESAPWLTVVWVPGKVPFASLARALLSALHPEADDLRLAVETARLARGLEAGTIELVHVLGLEPARRWVIAVDQPEELLLDAGAGAAGAGAAGTSDAGVGVDGTPTAGDPSAVPATPSRRLFEALLDAHADDRLAGRLALVIAVRTDDLDTLLHLPRLAARGGGEVVRYLGPVDDLREVIEGPLQHAGFAGLEPGLTDRLLVDVGEVPNPLPLLQFTLAELWRRRRAGLLTHAAYDELGGVRRAVANHAERLVASFDEEDLAAARDVLLQLGRPGPGDKVARRSARFDELGERGKLVVARLAAARLVVTDRDADGVERVEVAHEALFEHWPRLASWWQEAAGFRRWQESMRFALRAWREGGEDPVDLLHGPRLRAAEAHLRDRPGAFTAAELAFVMRSGERELAENEAASSALQRQLRLRRRLNLVLSLGLVVAAGLATVTIKQVSSLRALRAEAERLLFSATEANSALNTLAADLEESLGASRAVLATRLGIQAVAMATAPTTFGGDMRLAALMAAHAVRLDPGPASYDRLLRVLQAQPTYRATLAVTASAVALSPDARTVLVGGVDGYLRRFDGVTGAALGAAVGGHDGPVTALAFTAAGEAISGGDDGSLYLWRVDDGLQRLRSLPDALAGPIAHVAVSADDARVLAADLAGSVASIDVRGGGVPAVGDGRDMSFVAQLATFGADVGARRDSGVAVSASAVDGLDPIAVATHRRWASLLAAHPTRPLVAVGRGQRIAVLDAVTLREQWSVPVVPEAVAAIGFNADGSDLVIATVDGVIAAIDVARAGAGAPRTWVSRIGDPQVIAAGGEQGSLLVGAGDGSATWVDYRQGRRLQGGVDGHDQPLVQVIVGRDLLVTVSSDGRVVTWDRTPRNTLGGTVGRVGFLPRAAALDPSDRWLYLGSGGDGRLARFDLATGEVVAEQIGTHAGEVWAIAPAGDGAEVATVGLDGHLDLRDPVTLATVGTPFTNDRRVLAVVDDQARQAWLVGAAYGLVVAVAKQDGGTTVLRPASSGWSPGAVVATSPDGALLAVAAEDLVELWRDGTVVATGHTRPGRNVLSLAFTPDGSGLLSSGSGDATLWSVPALLPVANWDGAHHAVMSPDATLIAVAGNDGAVRLFDADTRSQLGRPVWTGPEAATTLTFTHDGSSLVITTPSGEVLTWRTSPAAWLDAACAMAWRDLDGTEVARFMNVESFEPVCSVRSGP